ncbi:hypothetical protein Micbo1qcDRAFT_202601 [Microdochium bolleyi]|uniref:Uncharacterized protein n=1 Tax=Microdochium bolleyi TaxID=196109 RepID=A0A136JC98_9PEZI|nr:hypothetical protein Micbo1qcDRAFT_202601 [Microdochium bolleyi]
MPVSTVLSQATFTNLGPLTTTYTAPASCYTPTNVYLGWKLQPQFLAWGQDCAALPYPPASDCIPEGSVWDADLGSETTTNHFFYHSPGIVCPKSWTTAGVAFRIGEGALNTTGVFNPTPTSIPPGVDYSPGSPIINPLWNIGLENLDADETMVACCPSGYTASPYGGRCYSTRPTSVYTASTGCRWTNNAGLDVQVTFPFNGTTATGFAPATLMNTSTIITTFSESELTSFTGIAMLPMVTMFYRASDVPADASSATTSAAPSGTVFDVSSEPSSDEPSETTTEAPPPPPVNKASSFKLTGGDGTAGIMVTVWAAAALMGAVLFGG